MMMMMMGKKERKAQTQKLFFFCLPGFFTHDAQLNQAGGKEDQPD